MAGPDSLELARTLVDQATGSPAALPPDLYPAYELGQLVAQCMYADADEVTTQRIAELMKSLASEQWLTGNLSSGGSPESVHRTVINRITELDRLLSTLPWPQPAAKSEEADANDSPYLTIPEAAKLLRVGEDTINRMIANGDLPFIEISGRKDVGGRKLKRILRESLEAAMKKQQRTEYTPGKKRMRRNSTPDFIGDD